MNMAATRPHPPTLAYIFHISRRLATYAVLTTCCWTNDSVCTTNTLEMAFAAEKSCIKDDDDDDDDDYNAFPSAVLSSWPCEAKVFWNTTPPTTMEMDVDRLRTKPNKAVALAMSAGSKAV